MSFVEQAVIFEAVKKLTKVLQDNFGKLEKKEIQKVIVIHERDEQTRVRLGRATTTETARPETADIEWDNPLDKDSKIKSISIIPNDAFKLHGMISININGVDIFKNDNVADFTDIGSLTIPLNPQDAVLKRGKKLKIYLWTDDGTSSALTATATFGSGDIE